MTDKSMKIASVYGEQSDYEKDGKNRSDSYFNA